MNVLLLDFFRAWVCLVGAVAGVFAEAPNAPAGGGEPAEAPVACAARGRIGVLTTRFEDVAGRETEVEVRYATYAPPKKARGLVVLLAGGVMETGIVGDERTGEVASVGDNFLVRSAPWFAQQGYFAVVLDRPSTTAGFTKARFDRFRVSAAHAQDIAAVVSRVNKENLSVFLAGTSRGAISAVAQHKLAVGVSLSSPVTSASGDKLYLGRPGAAELDPALVTVPVHVLAHRQDGCPVTQPADSLILAIRCVVAGVPTALDFVDGGQELSENPCGGSSHHGFLGVEREAVRKITDRFTRLLSGLSSPAPSNRRPSARSGRLSIRADAPVGVDLSTLASDPDGDALTFSLVHDLSSRGAALTIHDCVVTYAPSNAGVVDGFVYGVADGKGGVCHGVITVRVGDRKGRLTLPHESDVSTTEHRAAGSSLALFDVARTRVLRATRRLALQSRVQESPESSALESQATEERSIKTGDSGY